MKLQIETAELVVFESALFRTTTTLLIGENYLLLVDPNWLAGEVQFIRDYVDTKLGARQGYLFFTHSDYDHIIGWQKFPDFKTIASQAFVENPDQAKILQQIEKFDDEHYIKRDYKIAYPTIDFVITGNEQLQLGSDTFEFFQAPGHNRDGMIAYSHSKSVLIVGDYLSNVEFPFVYHSFAFYDSTLDQLDTVIQNHDIQYLISGHGDITNDFQEIRNRMARARSYLMAIREAVSTGTDFDLDYWLEKYDFPGILTQFHQGNWDLAKKEFLVS